MLPSVEFTVLIDLILNEAILEFLRSASKLLVHLEAVETEEAEGNCDV